MKKRLFVIGLGNPGKEYELTRHNIGKMFIEFMVERNHVKMSPGKGRFYFGVTESEDRILYMAVPTTYMNLSGSAVKELSEQFKVSPEELLIVCDDLNLPFGYIRLRMSGSDGGQKGLRSVIENLETENVPRLRLGIGNNENTDAKDYVLDLFEESEKERLSEIFEESYECIITMLQESPEKAMSRFNKRVKNKQEDI